MELNWKRYWKGIFNIQIVQAYLLNLIHKFRFPQLFDEEKCGDADFNILSLYLTHEKIKGEDSFWHPYFELNQRSYTLLDWTP